MFYDLIPEEPDEPPRVAAVTDMSALFDFTDSTDGDAIRLAEDVALLRGGEPSVSAVGYWYLTPVEPYLVTFVDGTKAVASREGLVAYLHARGQAVPDGL